MDIRWSIALPTKEVRQEGGPCILDYVMESIKGCSPSASDTLLEEIGVEEANFDQCIMIEECFPNVLIDEEGVIPQRDNLLS